MMKRGADMTRADWQINIENLVGRVTEKYGAEVAQAAFIRAGATCFEDLFPCFYEEVFSDLMLMDEDE